MFSTYIIENLDGKRYIGSTQNIADRMIMHNSEDREKARFHRTIYKKGPWKVIFHKDFEKRSMALEFEKFLKTGKGRLFLERARLGG